MSELIDVTRAELFKLVRRPAAWTLLAASLVLNQVFGYLIPYLSYRSGSGPAPSASPSDQLAATLPDQVVGSTIGGFPVFAGALALVLGALVFGGEYGWGTVKTVLTQRPGRLTALAGQAVALLLAVLAGVLAMFALSALSSSAIALAEERALDWPDPAALLAGIGAGLLILLVWALLGAALGVVLRGVALPIGLGVVWVLGVENLLSAMASTVLTELQPLRDVLPGANAGSLAAAVMPDRPIPAPPGVTTSVGDTRALVTLVCYLLVCAAVAAWTVRRRDVV
ncbi:MAG: ABC transporter permease subunit [Nocardioidaceae bacterium]